MNCIIIDDEPLALELLEDNIRKFSFLTLSGKFLRITEAIEFLSRNQVDLIFLDIRMPEIDGISFLKSYIQKPMIILVTAYDSYALESFELDIVDYLLKPVSFQRFFKAVNKAYNLFQQKKENVTIQESIPQMNPLSKFIFVKSEHKIIKINIEDIRYIESLKDYVKIYIGEKPILTLLSLKHLEELLPPDMFIRVHRSFIVSLLYIKYIARSRVVIGEKFIPLGNIYKEVFLKSFLDKKE